MPNTPHISVEEYSDKTTLLHKFFTLEDSQKESYLVSKPKTSPYLHSWDTLILYGEAFSGAQNIPHEVLNDKTIDNITIIYHETFYGFQNVTFGVSNRTRYLFVCGSKKSAFDLNKHLRGIVVEFLPHPSTSNYATDVGGVMG